MLMSHGDFARAATMVFNRRKKNSMISNIRDNGQVSLLARKKQRTRVSFLTVFPALPEVILMRNPT